jgi:hypothetical protein
MGKVATDLSTVTTVGLDIAKLVFQVHGVDAAALRGHDMKCGNSHPSSRGA